MICIRPPVASHFRARLERGAMDVAQSARAIRYALLTAGSPTLMTDGVIQSLAEHSMGNYRMLVYFASELLVAGLRADAAVIDEKFLSMAIPKRGILAIFCALVASCPPG